VWPSGPPGGPSWTSPSWTSPPHRSTKGEGRSLTKRLKSYIYGDTAKNGMVAILTSGGLLGRCPTFPRA
jgi:hypothetical protein